MRIVEGAGRISARGCSRDYMQRLEECGAHPCLSGNSTRGATVVQVHCRVDAEIEPVMDGFDRPIDDSRKLGPLFGEEPG